jgi:hypothetical protein
MVVENSNNEVVKEPSREERFLDNLIDLLTFIGVITKNIYDRGLTSIPPSAFNLGVTFLKSHDKETVLYEFIEGSNTHWDMIKARDEDFFSKHSKTIFGPLPFEKVEEYVDMFKLLFELKDNEGEYIVNKKQRDVIWDFLDSFVKISIKHVHAKREPVVRTQTDKDGKQTKVPMYLKNYCGKLEVPVFIKHAQKWGVVLKFETKKVEVPDKK